MIHASRLLARFKLLRGTAFDPFGCTAERKAERRQIEDHSRYEPAGDNFSPFQQCWKHPLGSQAVRWSR